VIKSEPGLDGVEKSGQGIDRSAGCFSAIRDVIGSVQSGGKSQG
jgi:hypothetical protein